MYGGSDFLSFCRDPDWFSSPPEWLQAPVRICVVKLFLQLGIPKCVPNDAMSLRIHARGHCVVVRESDTGEAWKHVLGGYAFLYELVEGGCKIAVKEVGTEAVERYENGRRCEKRGAVGHHSRRIFDVLGRGEPVCGSEQDDEQYDNRNVYDYFSP